jgi:hypothetical protein
MTLLPGSLLARLLIVQVCCDLPVPTDPVDDESCYSTMAAATAASPVNAADLKYARAVATFDEEVWG